MSEPAGQVRIQVDGRACGGKRGQGLLDALRQAGFEVPSLCHLAGLSPYGACRLCLVEVGHRGRTRLTTACNHPLIEGLEVRLDTPRVQRHRRRVLELLLTRAPNSKRLAALAARYGVTAPGFAARPQADGCILCGLCVRICRQGARAEALALAGRGERRELARRPFGEFPEACIGCGACAWVCPTGAIQMEAEAVARQRARWGSARPCRFALLGLAPGSVCEHDHQCWRCEVEQRLVDRAGGRHPVMLLLESGQEDHQA